MLGFGKAIWEGSEKITGLASLVAAKLEGFGARGALSLFWFRNSDFEFRISPYIDGMELINKHFTLDYWPESGWFEGRLREIPEVLSQGQTIEELEEHVREDCAEFLLDEEYAREHGYAHLEPADIRNADLKQVELNRYQAACAQLQALSPERAEKVFIYIEDLVDLEALERRADADDAARRNEEFGGEEEW